MIKRVKFENLNSYLEYQARLFLCNVEDLITEKEMQLAKEQGYIDIVIY